jgi:hypothetical protein
MKRHLSYAGELKQTASALIFFTLLFIWLNGCKKSETTVKEKLLTSTRDIPKDIMDKFRSTPNKMFFPGDGTIFKGIVIDRFGNEITRERLASRELSIPCDYNDAAFIDNTFNNKGETVTFGCTTSFENFQVVGIIQFTTGFNIQLTNPLNSSEHSRIDFRIRSAAYPYSVLYTASTLDIASGDIENMGTVLGNPDLTIYHITYTSPLITSVTSPAGVYFEYKPYIYTDCADALVTPRTWIKKSIATDYSDPCKRIDWVDVASG